MTVETITPVKCRRGAPVGNRNSYKHGFYSRQKTPAVLALDSVRVALPGMPSIDPRSFVNENLLLIEKIDSVLAVLAPKMLLAGTHKDTLSWFRPILKLVRAKQKVIRSILLIENPRRTLLILSRNLLHYVLWEFRERGLREFPIHPPPDFEQFCVSPSSTPHSFINNYIFHPRGAKGIDPRIFFESTRYHLSSGEAASSCHRPLPGHESLEYPPLMIPSPFLTDQQWLRIEKSFHEFREKMDSDRKRDRRKNDFPARLLFEAIFIKFAFDFRWEDLPRIFHCIHPDLPLLSHRKCQSFHSSLYNSGFLQGVYRQLFLHLRDYGAVSLESSILSGCFQLDDSAVSLAPGQPLTWQNFTSLLLLQRAYHNFRAIQREGRDR